MFAPVKYKKASFTIAKRNTSKAPKANYLPTILGNVLSALKKLQREFLKMQYIPSELRKERLVALMLTFNMFGKGAGIRLLDVLMVAT